jgi:CheY-like chemotaxis protein
MNRAANVAEDIRHVLVIEDEPKLRSMLADNLEFDGYQVTAVASGEEGLQAFAHQAFSLLLLDVMLPGISGFDVCRSLRAQGAIWSLADQAWVPSPLSLSKKLDTVTGPFAYLRLLGDRAEVDALTKTLDHIVIDRPEQIQADAQVIRLLSERVPVLVFVNNHFAGYAPETLRQLQQALTS